VPGPPSCLKRISGKSILAQNGAGQCGLILKLTRNRSVPEEELILIPVKKPPGLGPGDAGAGLAIAGRRIN